jgi:4-methyl-5(b-hydroxyethyl)-thiazole monophosphate biosynthesis
MSDATKRVLVPLADGVEEIEAVAVVDILRRAGCDVVTASVDEMEVKARCGTRLVADTKFSDVAGRSWDLVVIPGGGPGVERLRGMPEIRHLVQDQVEKGRLVGAICAGPRILADAGLLDGKRAACHASAEEGMEKARIVTLPVVEDGWIVTSRGPGTAVEFALRLVRRLLGQGVEDEVRKQIHA